MSKYRTIAVPTGTQPRRKEENYPQWIFRVCDNGGKVRYLSLARKKAVIQRSRFGPNDEPVSIFITQQKGGKMRTHRLYYDDNNVETRVLIIKTTAKDWQEHVKKFRELAPELGWYDERK